MGSAFPPSTTWFEINVTKQGIGRKEKLKVGKRGREKRKEDREGVEGAQQREMQEVVVESIALVEFSDNGEKLSFFFFLLAALRLSMRLSWGGIGILPWIFQLKMFLIKIAPLLMPRGEGLYGRNTN